MRMVTIGRISRTKRFIRKIKSIFGCFHFRRQNTLEDSISPSGSSESEVASSSYKPDTKSFEVTGCRQSQSGSTTVATRHFEEVGGPLKHQLSEPWINEQSKNCSYSGLVYRGQLFTRRIFTKRGNDGEEVAIKTLQGSYHQSLTNGFLKESCILSNYKDQNVLSLIGVCVDGGLVPFVVMPFITNSSLLNFLDNMKVENQLLGMCLQVAKGLKYLTNHGIAHRDQAARNCMVDSHLLIKVFNFGQCEELKPSTNYLKHTESDMKISLNWMDPNIFNDVIFPEKTNVWANGMAFWEIFSCGKIACAQVDRKDLLAMLHSGCRMKKSLNKAYIF